MLRGHMPTCATSWGYEGLGKHERHSLLSHCDCFGVTDVYDRRGTTALHLLSVGFQNWGVYLPGAGQWREGCQRSREHEVGTEPEPGRAARVMLWLHLDGSQEALSA